MKNIYFRGDVYYAELGTGIGSEQNGCRPVVIIQNDVGNKHSPTTIVAAISTQIKTKAYLIAYLFRDFGGAYETVKYAKKQGKPVINLAEQK